MRTITGDRATNLSIPITTTTEEESICERTAPGSDVHWPYTLIWFLKGVIPPPAKSNVPSLKSQPAGFQVQQAIGSYTIVVQRNMKRQDGPSAPLSTVPPITIWAAQLCLGNSLWSIPSKNILEEIEQQIGDERTSDAGTTKRIFQTKIAQISYEGTRAMGKSKRVSPKEPLPYKLGNNEIDLKRYNWDAHAALPNSCQSALTPT